VNRLADRVDAPLQSGNDDLFASLSAHRAPVQGSRGRPFTAINALAG
jgi:hypothetical protein